MTERHPIRCPIVANKDWAKLGTADRVARNTEVTRCSFRLSAITGINRAISPEINISGSRDIAYFRLRIREMRCYLADVPESRCLGR